MLLEQQPASPGCHRSLFVAKSGRGWCLVQCCPRNIPACVQVRDVKTPILAKAADRIRTDSSFRELRAGAEAFRQQNPWVEDSALFYALSHHREELIGKAWWDWPEPVR